MASLCLSVLVSIRQPRVTDAQRVCQVGNSAAQREPPKRSARILAATEPERVQSASEKGKNQEGLDAIPLQNLYLIC
jgi:hypothetical protein